MRKRWWIGVLVGMQACAAVAVEVRFESVAKNVNVHVGDIGARSVSNEGLNANLGLVVTPAGAVLIDSGATWRSAREIQAAARRVSTQPIRWVINTGGQDHRWLGNGYFKAQGAEIIAAAAAIDDMNGRGAMQMEGLKGELKEKLAGTEAVLPTKTFAKERLLKLGGRDIHLLHFQPAHTPGDSIVWLPQEGVVFAGDLVFVDRLLGVLPFSSAGGWLASFEEMAKLKPRLIIPGHGEVCDLAKARHETADYLRLLMDHMVKAVNQGKDLQAAIDSRTRRGSRVRDRMQEELLRETFDIATEGSRIGQINGLAVLQLGEVAFGHPQRISATVALGSGEVIDIEREVKLGGPLHSKGVLILSGFLGSHYVNDRPLSLSASLVFEQSYGGVDGDSASTAELCALVSALAGVPLKQSLAITGSIDQHGKVQAIGGVNEKIEGFFDLCRKRGLSGAQGVLIPTANVKHLMLRRDVVEAGAAGKFRVFPVAHVDQALSLLTGLPAGERNAAGEYPEGSLNRRICERLIELAEDLVVSVVTRVLERRHTELREANERLVMAALNAKELQEAAEQAKRRQAEFLALVAQERKVDLVINGGTLAELGADDRFLLASLADIPGVKVLSVAALPMAGTASILAELDLPALTRRNFTPSPAAWEDQVLYFLMLDNTCCLCDDLQWIPLPCAGTLTASL